jgi:uncharacterized membrane protein
MEKVHLHLLANHFPILGAFFGIIVLIFGIARKSPPTLAAAYFVFIVSAIGGLVTYFTGGGAAGAVKELPGVSKALMREHAEMGTYTLWVFVLLAVLALIGVLTSRNHYDKIKTLAFVSLIVALVGFGIATYAGLLGGQVRHTEVRDAAMEKHAQEEHGE